MASSLHLEAFIGQGSSVEGLLIGWLHFQCCITVLLGLSKTFQLQVAQGSANTHTHTRHLWSLFLSPAANRIWCMTKRYHEFVTHRLWNRFDNKGWRREKDHFHISWMCCMAVASVCLLWCGCTYKLFSTAENTHTQTWTHNRTFFMSASQFPLQHDNNNLPTIVKKKKGGPAGDRMKSDLPAACTVFAAFLFRCQIIWWWL